MIDNGIALAEPLLVTRNLRYLVWASGTLPKVKGVLFENGTHPVPSGVWNSTSATGFVPATPTTSRSALPPFENAFT